MNTQYNQYCSHKELLHLDQTQSYTAISNSVMLHMISNSKIASAIRLWLLVRTRQSGFKDRETISMTIGEIAKTLNVSRTTIQNWQRLLIQEGYLEVKFRKTEQLNNLPNTYRASLPKLVQKQLLSKKTRQNNTSKELSLEKSNEEKETNSVQKRENEMVDVRLLNIPYKEKDEVNKESLSCFKVKLYRLTKDLRLPIWLNKLAKGIDCEISHSGGIKILNVPDHAKKIIKQSIDNNTGLIKKKFPHICGQVEFKCSVIEETKRALKNHKCQKEIQQKRSEHKLTNSNNHTLKRIQQRLWHIKNNKGLNINPKELERIKQEISFAITQGNLSHLDTIHGLNIALKLVENNRWQTPFNYQEG